VKGGGAVAKRFAGQRVHQETSGGKHDVAFQMGERVFGVLVNQGVGKVDARQSDAFFRLNPMHLHFRLRLTLLKYVGVRQTARTGRSTREKKKHKREEEQQERRTTREKNNKREEQNRKEQRAEQRGVLVP
jgi:uncharacterized protein YaiL (DUF2058 family)